MNLVFFFLKTTRKYTALTTWYNKPARVGKMSLSSCKKHCAVGNTPKATFYLTTVTFSRLSIKETSESRSKEKKLTQETKKSYLFALSNSCAKICLHSALKKHLICKRFYSNSDSLYSLRDQVLICILEKAKFV